LKKEERTDNRVRDSGIAADGESCRKVPCKSDRLNRYGERWTKPAGSGFDSPLAIQN
jgi:hypothetical protein